MPQAVRAERTAAPATASDPSQLCDAAAAQASRETGVPLAVLQAISLNETGRRRDGAFRPWPWTVNMEGKGTWFDSAAEALAYAERNRARGARSFDVGCFQLNYRWHGQNFASLEAMFDPLANARYAARFLAELYAEKGDWSLAAGAYHSRTPGFAERYAARFDRILARIDGAPAPQDPGAVLAAAGTPAPALAAADPAGPRVNNFPLLRASAAAAGLGSLVPLGGSGRRLFDPSGAAALAAEAGDAG